jgi:cytochrome c oxidase subunit II
MSAGCAQCHAIRGTQATGNVGPDLTHLGSRRTIGAALLPNNRGNLAGWIANPQAIKPGVKMPRSYLPPDDLLDLVTYMESLK